jgi:hypothetical protein
MTHNGVVAAGGRLTDWISLGVLASSVPRDAVDEAVAAADKGARRSDGKLPPHVMVYFAMALALFADEDYEEVAARLTETLASWGCWDQSWATPTSGGLTQARKRLGPEPLELLFDQVAVPVAGALTRGAFRRNWRLMAVDGFALDVPDTRANAAAFGYPAGGRERPAFPKVRVVTIGECGSHAKVAVHIGPVGAKGSSEQALARRMFGRLEEDWDAESRTVTLIVAISPLPLGVGAISETFKACSTVHPMVASSRQEPDSDSACVRPFHSPYSRYVDLDPLVLRRSDARWPELGDAVPVHAVDERSRLPACLEDAEAILQEVAGLLSET